MMTDTDRLAMLVGAANGVIAILMDGLQDGQVDADALVEALELYRVWTERTAHILGRYAHGEDCWN